MEEDSSITAIVPPNWNMKIISSMKVEKKNRRKKKQRAATFFPHSGMFSVESNFYLSICFSPEKYLMTETSVITDEKQKLKYKTTGPQLHLSDPLTWPTTTTASKQNKRKNIHQQLFSAQAVHLSSPFWGCIFPLCCCRFFCLVHGHICVCTFALHALNCENKYS